MLSLKDGRSIGTIEGGKYDNEILFLKDISNDEEDSGDNYTDVDFEDGIIKPLLDMKNPERVYITGPSGSGKTTHAVSLCESFKMVHPEKEIYLFSRSEMKDDPAFMKLRPIQIMIDQKLLEHPIDITKDIKGGALILFDDCATVQDDKLKKIVEKLISDCLECARKYSIWLIITSHLIIGNEKKLARTILNELQRLVIFPKSGSSQQIAYALKTYMGLSKKQINKIINIRSSRWVTIFNQCPQAVMCEKGAYIL